ncbi:MAG: phosphodiester glycosidase family protein [bacterium]
MKNKIVMLVMLVSLSFCITNISLADWANIGPGFDYQEFYYSIPIGQTTVYVARMSRASTNCVIDSMIAQGRFNKTGLVSTRETVSGMANRYDDTINFWGTVSSKGAYNGTRTQVIAAINGDYWDTTNNYLPQSGQVQSGWFCKRFQEYTGGSGYVYKGNNRSLFLGGNVRNGEVPNQVAQLVAFTVSTATITHVNTIRGTNELIIYTPQYGPSTYTDDSGVEVVVQMVRPNVPFPIGTSYSLGSIIQIRSHLGSTPIPFDSVVFSGHGNKTTLLSQCTLGQSVRVYMHIKDYGTSGTPSLPNDQDWGQAYSSIGGAVYCVVSSIPWSDNSSKSEYVARRGRTAIAFNSTYAYFVVVDGGQYWEDHGMQFSELGSFCVDSLQAEYAIAEDGGGSSAIWINGVIKNHPSDGSERATTNGLMMVNVLPMSKTSTYISGSFVVSTTSITVRLGPGTNYAVVTTLPKWTQGIIGLHSFNGVYATGKNWWKCQFGSTEGWVEETLVIQIPVQLIDFEAIQEPHNTKIIIK